MQKIKKNKKCAIKYNVMQLNTGFDLFITKDIRNITYQYIYMYNCIGQCELKMVDSQNLQMGLHTTLAYSVYGFFFFLFCFVFFGKNLCPALLLLYHIV